MKAPLKRFLSKHTKHMDFRKKILIKLVMKILKNETYAVVTHTCGRYIMRECDIILHTFA